MSLRFQVDLAGIVDLLSSSLYSGPQVYVREALQNAVDALTARRALDPDAPATVRLRTLTDGAIPALEVTDSGIGLTADEAAELLATIGRTSKRDADFGTGRQEYIGQFGIGLLAAFMVADRVEVRSRSMQPAAAPIRWTGFADGTFEILELPDDDIPVGTTIRLTARHGMEHWLANDTVVALAADYCALLPFDIAVAMPVDGVGERWRRITLPELPWRVAYPTASAREAALAHYCAQVFGFTPLAAIDLDLPVAGVCGVAFVLPQAVAPNAGQHRVYTKRMLLGHRVEGVLPEWAFFTRAVVNADLLAPTASREQLRIDDTLLGVREALGDQLRRWALDTLREPTPLTRAILQTHHLALRALALTDSQMLDLVAQVLPYETTDGAHTLADAARAGEIVYTTTPEAYRRVAAVARAQGLVVVNAGYVYDADIVQRLANLRGWRARELERDDLVQVLGVVSVARELAIAGAVAHARELLEPEDCDVIVRTFEPASVPAILLRDSENEHRRDRDRERAAAPDLWGGLLDSFAGDATGRTRTLVLNDDATVVRRLLGAGAAATGTAAPTEIFAAGLRSLYLSAVMLAGEGLRSAESAALADSLGTLLDAALTSPQEDG